MSDLVVQFRELYQRHWSQFVPYYRENLALSSPLLMNPPRAYASQKHKLMVIGRETKTWYNAEGRTFPQDEMIDGLMGIYRDKFNLGMGLKRSVFWQFVRALENRLGITPGAVCWSNIHKCDFHGTQPSPEIATILRERLPVLRTRSLLQIPMSSSSVV